MALTRMQQRRGPASDWTDSNAILASGEIGYETDTKKFKIGDGVSTWPTLPYFENEVDVAAAIQAAVDGILDLPPETLDTLNELAAALGDDPDFFNTVVYKAGSTMSGPLILSADPSADLEAATKQYVDSLETMEPGGTTGQALTKSSNDDYDVQWTTVAFDLNGLNDVDTSGAVDKNTLVYEEDTNSWVAGPGGGRFTVSETPPVDVLNGDTWLDSTTGNSYLYYEDYDNPQWIQIAGPGLVGTRGSTLFIGTTAPVNTVEGDLWYDSEEGFTYIYYVDADSSQWIQFGLNRNGANGSDGTPGEAIASINDIPDVEISDLSDNEILAYDSVSSSWINQTFSEISDDYYTKSEVDDAIADASGSPTASPSVFGSGGGVSVTLITLPAFISPSYGSQRITEMTVSLFNEDTSYFGVAKIIVGNDGYSTGYVTASVGGGGWTDANTSFSVAVSSGVATVSMATTAPSTDIWGFAATPMIIRTIDLAA